MGNYVNNTEACFQSIVNTGMYVDKTGLFKGLKADSNNKYANAFFTVKINGVTIFEEAESTKEAINDLSLLQVLTTIKKVKNMNVL